MAAQLFQVRTQFVEKVTTAVIKQLLDDLLVDGVLNDGEGESIKQGNKTRADQARELIDSVRRKGDRASKWFITRLQQRDSHLHAALQLPDLLSGSNERQFNA